MNGIAMAPEREQVRVTQPLEVVPFPTAPVGRALVEQLLHLDHVALAPAGGGPGDVVEVALEFGLVQGLIGLPMAFASCTFFASRRVL